MKRSSILWILFGLLVIAQLAIPALMIRGQEKVLAEGVEYRFKSAPVDPYDLMRGKYITLSLAENSVNTSEPWSGGETAYLLLGTDSLGFAELISAQHEPPEAGTDYLEISLSEYSYSDNSILYVDLPFNRFYMEESKAKLAEDLYWDATREVQGEAFAQVMVLDGKAVLRDVIIDGIPIQEAVRSLQDEKTAQ